MDRCPADLIALILEHLPLRDLGKTVRTLGLVSKYYRRVTKPFEFRALVIVDSEELEATLDRIKAAQEEQEDGAIIDVRHLFIFEMELDIGDVDVDLDYEFMDDEERVALAENEDAYRFYADEFRTYAAALVHIVRTTLVTLSVAQRFADTLHDLDDLRIISGSSFPRLENLILEHSGDISEADFVVPTAPLLRRIHLSARRIYDAKGLSYANDGTVFIHPLLANMHSRFATLTHLVLCGEGIHFEDDLSAVLCGSVNGATKLKSVHPTNRRLPGRLAHVVLEPRYEYESQKARTKEFCENARALRIDGLEVREPRWMIYRVERGDLCDMLQEFEGLVREHW